jgi:hypothetical protein
MDSNSLYILDVVTVMGPEIDTSTSAHTATEDAARSLFQAEVDTMHSDDKWLVRLLKVVDGSQVQEIARLSNLDSEA